MCELLSNYVGNAAAKTTSSWLPAAGVQVRCKGSPLGICDKQSGSDVDFSLSSWGFPYQYQHSITLSLEDAVPYRHSLSPAKKKR